MERKCFCGERYSHKAAWVCINGHVLIEWVCVVHAGELYRLFSNNILCPTCYRHGLDELFMVTVVRVGHAV